MIELLLLVCTTTGSLCVQDSIKSFESDARMCLFQAPALTHNHMVNLGDGWELKKWECKVYDTQSNRKDTAQNGF